MKPPRQKVSADVRKQFQDVYSRCCILCDEEEIVCAHVHDQRDLSAFLDLVPLCRSCNAIMDESGNALRQHERFKPQHLLDLADGYYTACDYWQSFKTYELLGFAYLRSPVDLPAAVSAFANATRAARNLLGESARSHSRAAGILRHPAEALIRNLEDLGSVLAKMKSIPESAKLDALRACRIAFAEIPGEAARGRELAEFGAQKYVAALIRDHAIDNASLAGLKRSDAVDYERDRPCSWQSFYDLDAANDLSSSPQEKATCLNLKAEIRQRRGEPKEFDRLYDKFEWKTATSQSKNRMLLARGEQELDQGHADAAIRTLRKLQDPTNDPKGVPPVYVMPYPQYTPKAEARLAILLASRDIHARLIPRPYVPAIYLPEIKVRAIGILQQLGMRS